MQKNNDTLNKINFFNKRKLTSNYNHTTNQGVPQHSDFDGDNVLH